MHNSLFQSLSSSYSEPHSKENNIQSFCEQVLFYKELSVGRTNTFGIKNFEHFVKPWFLRVKSIKDEKHFLGPFVFSKISEVHKSALVKQL
jgi:hypothetical protein